MGRGKLSAYIKAKLELFIKWRKKSVSDHSFILILSVFIGLSVGLAAVTIKNLVHVIQEYAAEFIATHSILYLLLFPSLGIFLTIVFIKFINRRPVEHGIPSVLYSISRNKGKIERHNLFSSVISSALTVGFGGSVGLEGPTVATGAAIGSNVGRSVGLTYKQITLLLGCACAGAMSAIFKAPVAAIVFALEVIMLDLTMAAIVPLLISSATAAVTSYLFLGQNFLYNFAIKEPFILSQIPFYIALGILTGLVSAYFTKSYLLIAKLFEKFNFIWFRFLLGGLILGIIIFFIPALYGEGYEAINKSLEGNWNYLFENAFYKDLHGPMLVFFLLIAVVLFKAIAVGFTFGAGGIGGVFAPSLFIGANTGLFFALACNTLGFDLSTSNFALTGMAGLISGFIHAPLTGMFLIAEITGGYELFLPLMLVATISYATAKIFFKNSVYTYQLAIQGHLMTHHKDKAVLMMLDIRDLIETDFHVLYPDQSLRELIRAVTKAHRNIFPVIDHEGMFRGMIKLDDIRHIMFNAELYDNIYVRDVMFLPDHVIDPRDSVEEIAHKFHDSGHYNIAVIEQGKYLGFISQARLFSAYRRWLRDFSEE
ncbi:MAG: CBS domain-containing protein [Bacteroidetes bacterium]|jgi:CIC family chloride channel protein|nr:CBS domain-containing protein [Bacteroidota bacterium]